MFQRVSNRVDEIVISVANRFSIPLGRFALFVVFFWFGILKVIGESPASPLVQSLFNRAFPIDMSFAAFFILFGIFEIVIGILFLIPKAEKIAFIILLIHMIMTSLPLFLLPGMVWTSAFVPTMEGQYIIKNLVIIGLALSLVAHLYKHKE